MEEGGDGVGIALVFGYAHNQPSRFCPVYRYL